MPQHKGRVPEVLELNDIQAGYGRTLVLHGVTLPGPGNVVAVLGHNGAGKSTLLRVAIGLIKPRSGHVIFDGEDVTSLPPNSRVARGMAYVPQGQESFSQLTTMENLQLVADGRKRGKGLIEQQLSRFPALEKFATRKAGLLSGGQRQQLAIARALITEPKLLILDESTSALDAESEKLLQDSLELVAKQTTVIAIAHRLRTIRKANVIFQIEAGQCFVSGTHEELMLKSETYRENAMHQTV